MDLKIYVSVPLLFVKFICNITEWVVNSCVNGLWENRGGSWLATRQH